MSKNRKNILAFLCFTLTCFVIQNAAQCATLPTDVFTKIDSWKPILSLNTPNTLIVSDVQGTLTDGRGRTINEEDWKLIKGNVLGFTSDNAPESFDFPTYGCVSSNGNQVFEKVSPTIKRIREIIVGRTSNKINSIVVVDDCAVILKMMTHKLKNLQECSGLTLHFFQFSPSLHPVIQNEEVQKKATIEKQSEDFFLKVPASSRPSELIVVGSAAHPSPTASPSSTPYTTSTFAFPTPRVNRKSW